MTSSSNAPASVKAAVKYITDTGEKRLIYVPSEAGQDNSKWAGRYEDRVVDIANARDLHEPFDLDTAGFALTPQTSAVTDFYDEEKIELD
ncbi:MAG: hypothetical protein VW516_09685 [Rhodospirillaceae bacterium]